jgi:hypothetical protein
LITSRRQSASAEDIELAANEVDKPVSFLTRLEILDLLVGIWDQSTAHQEQGVLVGKMQYDLNMTAKVEQRCLLVDTEPTIGVYMYKMYGFVNDRSLL